MRRKGALLAGIFAGLSSPACIASSPDYPRLQGSDMSRMRQDVQRIGGDFKIVIKREHGKSKATGK